MRKDKERTETGTYGEEKLFFLNDLVSPSLCLQ